MEPAFRSRRGERQARGDLPQGEFLEVPEEHDLAVMPGQRFQGMNEVDAQCLIGMGGQPLLHPDFVQGVQAEQAPLEAAAFAPHDGKAPPREGRHRA